MAPPSSVPANNSIQLVLQSASNSARMDIPGEWNKNDTLQSVLLSIRDRLFGIDMSQSSIRYLQSVVDSKDWDTTSLKKLGIDHGRTLLILQQTAAPATSTAATDVDGDVAMQMESTNTSTDPLESALQQLLDKNFDADTKMAIVTMIKIIDNILSKPNDPKVRTLKLSNAVIQKKIASRPGAGTLR
jgi:PUB domain